MVSISAFLAIVFSFLLMLLPLPALFIFLWRKRQFPVNSFFSGAAVFILFYLVLRYYAMTAVGDQAGRGTFLSLLVSAVLVEVGRLAGFYLLPQKGTPPNRMPEKSIKSGLSLALGYMTAAFILISSFEMAMNFVYAGALEGWDFLYNYLSRFPQESIDRVQSMILDTPPLSYLLETLSLYLAVPVQLCLTLLVFEFFRCGNNKKQGKKRGFFLLGAVAGDFFYYQLSSAVVGYGWVAHLLYLAFFGGFALIIIGKLWKEEILDTISVT